MSTEAGQIVVVDTESQAVVATYASHAMAVRTISWSPDSQVCLSSVHSSLVFADDVQWLFSGADDHRIVLHDVRAGSKTGSGGKGEGAVAIMQGHQSWVLKVAASPDGKLLGSG
jgi:WD repeat-containing protein 61